MVLSIIACNQQSDEVTLVNLSGKWINESNHYMEIVDTTDNRNFIGINVHTIGKHLQIYGDTLSFQEKYYAEFKYLVQHKGL